MFWYIKTEKGWLVGDELILVISGTVVDIDVWMLFCYKMVVLVEGWLVEELRYAFVTNSV